MVKSIEPLLNAVPIQRRVVIGIPTFRRPKQLSALLDSLLPQLHACPAFIIVGDNDCGTEAAEVVARFRRSWPDSSCIPVAARGVAQVRNALVAQAHIQLPDWQWLVMLDDDGTVTDGWLQHLLAAGDSFNAHLVGGPVQSVLPVGSNVLARNSIFAARRRWSTGLVPTLNGTQNLAIARSALDLVQEPLFRNEYGASGGEDYDLFRRMAQAHARMAWCDEAIVIEPPAVEQLTVRSLLHRYATTGAYMVLIDRSYDGQIHVWKLALKGLVASMLTLLLAGLSLKRDKFAKSLLSISHYSGRVAGLLGVRTARYVSENKS